jgi:hypothetical protein
MPVHIISENRTALQKRVKRCKAAPQSTAKPDRLIKNLAFPGRPGAAMPATKP